jgi:hypothetical protein
MVLCKNLLMHCTFSCGLQTEDMAIEIFESVKS